MADEFTVSVRRNDLIGRLQKLAEDMIDRNDHGEAFLVDLAIQALRSPVPAPRGATWGGGGGGSGGIGSSGGSTGRVGS